METESVDLNWEGPFSFAYLLTDPSAKEKYDFPGVYLWFEKKIRRLCYAGRSISSLLARHLQHNAMQIGGLYTIPAEFREENMAWIPKWSDPEVSKTLLSFDHFVDLARQAFSYRDQLEVYLCLLTRHPSEQIKAVERNLLFDLQPSGTVPGTKTIPQPRLRLVHHNASWADRAIRERQRDNRHCVFA